MCRRFESAPGHASVESASALEIPMEGDGASPLPWRGP